MDADEAEGLALALGEVVDGPQDAAGRRPQVLAQLDGVGLFL
jgi:hypothetical protein